MNSHTYIETKVHTIWICFVLTSFNTSQFLFIQNIKAHYNLSQLNYYVVRHNKTQIKVYVQANLKRHINRTSASASSECYVIIQLFDLHCSTCISSKMLNRQTPSMNSPKVTMSFVWHLMRSNSASPKIVRSSCKIFTNKSSNVMVPFCCLSYSLKTFLFVEIHFHWYKDITTNQGTYQTHLPKSIHVANI